MQRFLLWTATVTLVLLAFYGIWRFYTYDTGFFISAAASLPDELSAARAEGLPVEPDDLRPEAPIPDEQNAALIYKDLIARKQVGTLPRSPEKPFSDWYDAPTAATFGAAKKHAHTVSAMVEDLHRAAALPHCDFHRDYELGIALLLPEYADMKSYVRVLTGTARVKAADGDIDEAIRCLRSAIRVGEHVGQDPILVAMLVRIACDAIVYRAVEVIASQEAGDARSLKKLQEFIRALPPAPKYAKYLGGDTVGVRLAYRQMSLKELAQMSSGGSFGSGPTPEAAQRNDSVRVSEETKKQAYEAQWVRFCRRARKILLKYENQPHIAGKELDELVTSQSSDADPSYIAVEVMAPMYGQAGSSIEKLKLLRRLLLLKVDLLQFKLQHGRFPTSLAEVGGHAVDPFNSKPVVYKPGIDSFEILCVGPNGVPNGGRGDDVTVEHPMPAHKK